MLYSVGVRRSHNRLLMDSRLLKPNERVDSNEPWFTPDGREIWGRSDLQTSSVDRWAIVEGDGPGTAKLRPMGMTACPPRVPPWQSFRGYRVGGY